MRYTTKAMPKFILPSTDWALLLPPILKDAQPGDVLEVHTQAMWQITCEAVRQAGR